MITLHKCRVLANVMFAIFVSGCSLPKHISDQTHCGDLPVTNQRLIELYRSVFAIEDTFQPSYLTCLYRDDNPSYLSSIREMYAKLDSELASTPQFSNSAGFAELRNSLIRDYGATSFFFTFGHPVMDRYGSVLYISVNSLEFKEFEENTPQWRDVKFSALLKYRILTK